MLLVDHRDNGEEHDQQGGERQRLFKGVAESVLFDHAVESGQQHDDRQADQCPPQPGERPAHNEPSGDEPLAQSGHLSRAAITFGLRFVVLEHSQHRSRASVRRSRTCR